MGGIFLDFSENSTELVSYATWRSVQVDGLGKVKFVRLGNKLGVLMFFIWFVIQGVYEHSHGVGGCRGRTGGREE